MNLKKCLAILLTLTLTITCVVSGMSLTTTAANNEEAVTALKTAWGGLTYPAEVLFDTFYYGDGTDSNPWSNCTTSTGTPTKINVGGQDIDINAYSYPADDKTKIISQPQTGNPTNRPIDYSDSTITITDYASIYVYYKVAEDIKAFLVGTGSTSSYFSLGKTEEWAKKEIVSDTSIKELDGKMLWRLQTSASGISLSQVYGAKKLSVPEDTDLGVLVAKAEAIDLSALQGDTDGFMTALSTAKAIVNADKNLLVSYIKQNYTSAEKIVDLFSHLKVKDIKGGESSWNNAWQRSYAQSNVSGMIATTAEKVVGQFYSTEPEYALAGTYWKTQDNSQYNFYMGIDNSNATAVDFTAYDDYYFMIKPTKAETISKIQVATNSAGNLKTYDTAITLNANEWNKISVKTLFKDKGITEDKMFRLFVYFNSDNGLSGAAVTSNLVGVKKAALPDTEPTTPVEWIIAAESLEGYETVPYFENAIIDLKGLLNTAEKKALLKAELGKVTATYKVVADKFWVKNSSKVWEQKQSDNYYKVNGMHIPYYGFNDCGYDGNLGFIITGGSSYAATDAPITLADYDMVALYYLGLNCNLTYLSGDNSKNGSKEIAEAYNWTEYSFTTNNTASNVTFTDLARIQQNGNTSNTKAEKMSAIVGINNVTATEEFTSLTDSNATFSALLKDAEKAAAGNYNYKEAIAETVEVINNTLRSKIANVGTLNYNGDVSYNKDGTDYTAFRVFAQYICPNDSQNNPISSQIIVNGERYDITSRKIILYKDMEGELTENTDDAYVSEANTENGKLNNYWSATDNGDGTSTIQYSLCLKKITKDNAENRTYTSRAVIEYGEGADADKLYTKQVSLGTVKSAWDIHRATTWFGEANA